MMDRQTKQLMSKNRTKTQKHTRAVAAIVAAVVAVAVVVALAAVVAVGATVVKEEVAAGSPLDHGKVLELLSQTRGS
jgi:FlaG/FlaF family flagellin (archaellin)